MAGALTLGPLLILAVLLRMLGEMQTLALLGGERQADAGAWYGQFLGWNGVLGFFIVVALPTAAVGMALAAVHEPSAAPSSDLPWWSGALLWDQIGFIAGFVAALVLSSWLFGANVAAARRWLAALAPADLPAARPKPRTPRAPR